MQPTVHQPLVSHSHTRCSLRNRSELRCLKPAVLLSSTAFSRIYNLKFSSTASDALDPHITASF